MSDDEQKFGLEGVEQSQGYSPMVPADPVQTSEPEYREPLQDHLKRPAPPKPEIRQYNDAATGEETPPNQSVTAKQASHDLTTIREQERAERERQSQDDLKFALDQLDAKDDQPQPAPPADQPQPEIDQPQPTEAELDAARAQHDAAWAEADAEISKFLENPVVRERVEQSFDAVRKAASADIERANHLATTFQQHYATATNNLVAEASAVIGSLFPELQGLSGPQLQGAVAAMQRSNPQRAEALATLASKASNLMAAQQRQQYEAQAGQALQQQHDLEQFTEAEVKRYEAATKDVPAETMKAVRENVYPTIEKQ